MALPLLLALALGQAAPAPRDVTVARRPDGGFTAALDGQPVAGTEFYRAVLRFDLADQYDRAHDRKVALGVAAVSAPLVGLGVGSISAAVSERPPPSCLAVQPEPASCAALAQENAEWNQQHLRQGLVAGGLSGLAVGLVLGWLSWRIDVPEPTAAEAEGLVRRYRELNGLAPAGSLRLVPLPGGALLSLASRF